MFSCNFMAIKGSCNVSIMNVLRVNYKNRYSIVNFFYSFHIFYIDCNGIHELVFVEKVVIRFFAF